MKQKWKVYFLDAEDVKEENPNFDPSKCRQIKESLDLAVQSDADTLLVPRVRTAQNPIPGKLVIVQPGIDRIWVCW